MTWPALPIDFEDLPDKERWKLKLVTQADLDNQRKTYRIDFPTPLDADSVIHWLRSISGGLHTPASLFGHPSIVFETWSKDGQEITHYLSVPWKDAEFIIGQLRGFVPGITAMPEEFGRPRLDWTAAEEFTMNRRQEIVKVKDAVAMNWSILHTLPTVQQNEAVVLQWVITPTETKHVTEHESKFVVRDGFAFQDVPRNKDQLAARRAKVDEPNFDACFRVAAMAKTDVRASYLVHHVSQPIHTTKRFRRSTLMRRKTLLQSVKEATTPSRYGCQVSIPELFAFMSWPEGIGAVPGLSTSTFRHLAPTEAISRNGFKLGVSTLPGRERPIALTAAEGMTHTFINGGTGGGKSVLMENMTIQQIEQGYGVLWFDPKGDSVKKILDSIPAPRLKDVVYLNFSDEASTQPLGFNFFDQGNPRGVIDELVAMFEHKNPGQQGVWFRRLMHHGLTTLAGIPGSTFSDLIPLLMPNQTQEPWAKSVTDKVTDPALREFWDEWRQLTDRDKQTNIQPLRNRVWQLNSRVETRYLLNQSSSSFKMDEILSGNKILLVNFARLPKESAELIGTLLFKAVWDAAQRIPKPARENFVYMDEFQMFADLPMGFDDVAAMARSYKLGLVAATQYIERLPRELVRAIRTNFRTKIIFQSGSESAGILEQELGGRRVVGESTITTLPKYHAIVRINTEAGFTHPVTIKTYPPIKPYGSAQTVMAHSAKQYGRPIERIEQEELERRQVTTRRKTKDAPVGTRRVKVKDA